MQRIGIERFSIKGNDLYFYVIPYQIIYPWHTYDSREDGKGRKIVTFQFNDYQPYY